MTSGTECVRRWGECFEADVSAPQHGLVGLPRLVGLPQDSRHLCHWLRSFCLGMAQATDIPDRRLAEETAIFPIELGGAFIAHLKSRTRRVKTIVQHQVSCGLKPDLLLILKRAHRG